MSELVLELKSSLHAISRLVLGHNIEILQGAFDSTGAGSPLECEVPLKIIFESQQGEDLKRSPQHKAQNIAKIIEMDEL